MVFGQNTEGVLRCEIPPKTLIFKQLLAVARRLFSCRLTYSSKPILFHRHSHGFRLGADVEFFIDVIDVRPHRVGG